MLVDHHQSFRSFAKNITVPELSNHPKMFEKSLSLCLWMELLAGDGLYRNRIVDGYRCLRFRHSQVCPVTCVWQVL
jgi:hypothetical protein